MNTLPPLPQELGRFDSIVEAHNAGDMDRYIEALTANEKTICSIFDESFKLRSKYFPQLATLSRALAEAKYIKYKQERQIYGGEDAD